MDIHIVDIGNDVKLSILEDQIFIAENTLMNLYSQIMEINPSYFPFTTQIYKQGLRFFYKVHKA